eukprot:TRINITY_DN10366_c2_g1_i1.p1 TRINITY_DN10366_c2_g1~~TRINITY_DN10366_c2_g1_i1.p1  ORF type:complete len:504 (+),score=156.33 TRINITY_DN10366_c2_g1_i1:95-1606(+)
MDKIGRCHPACKRCAQPFSTDEESPQAPLLLPCGHSVCKQCGDESVAEATLSMVEGVQVKTMECAKGCVNPVEDGDVLPLHAELIEEMKTSKYSGGQALCEECEEATCKHWCPTCDTSLCQACWDMVHKPRTMQRHVAVPHAERPLPVEVCEAHGNPLLHYCHSCSKKVCSQCQTEPAHEGHTIVPLEEAASSAVERTKHQLNKLGDIRGRLRTASLAIQSRFVSLNVHAKDTEEKIETEFDRLRTELNKAIDKQQKRLLNECTALHDSKRQQLVDQRAGIAKSLSCVMQARDLYRDVIETKAELVLGIQPQLASKMGNVLASVKVVDYEPCAAPGLPVTFPTKDFEIMASNILAYGEVGNSNCPRITANRVELTSGNIMGAGLKPGGTEREGSVSLSSLRDAPRDASGLPLPAPERLTGSRRTSRSQGTILDRLSTPSGNGSMFGSSGHNSRASTATLGEGPRAHRRMRHLANPAAALALPPKQSRPAAAGGAAEARQPAAP